MGDKGKKDKDKREAQKPKKDKQKDKQKDYLILDPAKVVEVLGVPPEKVIDEPRTPAARARRSSPSETTSMPAPSRASVVSTAWLELALTA